MATALSCLQGCLVPVPPELAAERLCAFHFTQSIEESCREIRRENAHGKLTAERHVLIGRSLVNYSAKLASVATGTQQLSDELKKRILTTFLTLMTTRESLREKPGPEPT